jgi:ribosomal protein L40E
MSSIAPVQCLFCLQPNPAGASFCNDCGSQLNLKPCGRCGAVDDRAAVNCYKCGAEFTAATPPESSLAPCGPSGLVVTQLQPDSVCPPHEPPSVEIAFFSEPSTTKTGPRRWRFVAAAASLLTLAALALHFYAGVPPAREQGLKPPATVLPRAPMPAASAGSTVSTVAVPPGAVVRPESPPPSVAPQSAGPDVAPVPAAAGVGAAPSPRSPPANGRRVRRDAAQISECPPAVATLGLCNPGTKQEK